MTENWTPTDQQVRDVYRFDPEDDYRNPISAPYRANEAGRAFDRWLAQHDAEVRVEALQAAADAWDVEGRAVLNNKNRDDLLAKDRIRKWLRDRADAERAER